MPSVKMWAVIGKGDSPIGDNSAFRFEADAWEEVRKRRMIGRSFGYDIIWLSVVPVTVTWADNPRRKK
jgi:hypothetical protein